MDNGWVQIIAAVVGGVVSGIAGVFVALFTINRQNRATLAMEREIVRASLATELDLLKVGIKEILDQHDEVARTYGPYTASTPAMLTLATLSTKVYSAVLPEIGVLGAELADELVGIYVKLEHAIEQGREIDERVPHYRGPDRDTENDAEVRFKAVPELYSEIVRVLSLLRPTTAQKKAVGLANSTEP